MSFPEQASTAAVQVDRLFLALLGISGFFTLLIFVLIVYFAIRYRRQRGVPAHQGQPPLALEWLWTLGPLAITLTLFYFGASVYFDMQTPPREGEEISVVAKQWMWKFYHRDGRGEIGELHVPVGRPVRLVMVSEDVIHSFYVPAFRLKHDVLPSRYTTLWFTPTKPGIYSLFCAEYCGTKHSQMGGAVIVMEPAHYEQWLAGSAAAESLAERGQAAFARHRCSSCHESEEPGRGPRLVGRFGAPAPLASGGTVDFDDAYVRESILRPAAAVAQGFEAKMPAYPRSEITEEDIRAIIEYLKTS